MTQEITVNLVCISLRNNVELWVEETRAANLKQILISLEGSKFIDFDGTVINTADVIGIFDAATMESKTRRQNGQWQDKNGKWRNKGDRLCPGCGNILPYGKVCGIC